MRRELFVGAVAVLVMGGLASPVIANGPYLEPAAYGTNKDYVTIQAAHGAEVAFLPLGPIRTLGDFFAVSPDGVESNIGGGQNFKGLSVIEPALTKEGTWRISTGERAGRVQKSVLIDGQWRQIRQPQPAGAPGRGGEAGRGGEGRGAGVEAGRGPGGPAGQAGRPQPIDEKDIPTGARIVESTSYLRAETYVSRGAPSATAIKPTGKGFELAPTTHPNEIYAGEPFKFSLLNDGKAVGGVEFEIRRSGDSYRGGMFSIRGTTNPQGAASVNLKEPGRYILETSYPGQAQPGQPPVAKNTGYSLTFEVNQ